MSRIGKKPVELPSGVTAVVTGQTIEVKGPKGAFHMDYWVQRPRILGPEPFFLICFITST